jgi:tetratricopeptide (TPR) repeat protein
VKLNHPRVVRVVVTLLAVIVCLLLMQSAARIGFSRLLTRYAIGANSLAAADRAIQLTPSDAEAHRARAIVLNRLHRPAEAKLSLETATTLRSQHAALWLELGATREELGETEAALAAFDQAVRYAPSYAETHWQRGNLLLRMGRQDEAFADLRQAATDRKLLPAVIDLAWGIGGGNPQRAENFLQINNDEERLAFARFLARKGQGSETLNQVDLLNAPLSGENTQELIELLVAAKSFREGYRLWKGSDTSDGFVNGMFEDPLVFESCCFRWVISEGQAKAKFALDVAEKFSGQRSLQVSFNGEWDASEALLSQVIVLGPGHYRINFAVKTKDLVTGGPPRIVLTDAANDQVLAKSETFPQTTDSWRQLKVEFTIPSGPEAIVVSLKRENCASAPCPIFGTLWLDEFWFEKL